MRMVILLLIERLARLIVFPLRPLLVILLWRGLYMAVRRGMIVFIRSRHRGLGSLSSMIVLILHWIMCRLVLHRLHGLSGWLCAVIVLLGLCVELLLDRRAMIIGSLVVIVQAARPDVPTLIGLG